MVLLLAAGGVGAGVGIVDVWGGGLSEGGREGVVVVGVLVE